MLNIQSLKIINPAFFAEKKVKVRCASASRERQQISSDDTNTLFLSYLTFDGWVSRQEMVRLTGLAVSTITKASSFLKGKGLIIKHNPQEGRSRPVYFQKVKQC